MSHVQSQRAFHWCCNLSADHLKWNQRLLFPQPYSSHAPPPALLITGRNLFIILPAITLKELWTRRRWFQSSTNKLQQQTLECIISQRDEMDWMDIYYTQSIQESFWRKEGRKRRTDSCRRLCEHCIHKNSSVCKKWNLNI